MDASRGWVSLFADTVRAGGDFRPSPYGRAHAVDLPSPGAFFPSGLALHSSPFPPLGCCDVSYIRSAMLLSIRLKKTSAFALAFFKLLPAGLVLLRLLLFFLMRHSFSHIDSA